jgi:hypothetical protein
MYWWGTMPSGIAAGYHGYPRATGDMDIWIAVKESDAEKTALVMGNGYQGILPFIS